MREGKENAGTVATAVARRRFASDAGYIAGEGCAEGGFTRKEGLLVTMRTSDGFLRDRGGSASWRAAARLTEGRPAMVGVTVGEGQ